MAVRAYVYLLLCGDGTYYTGWTSNLARRLAAHQAGRGARYTRARLPVCLAYYEDLPDARAARQREYRLRRQSHAAKRALAAAHPPAAALPAGPTEEEPAMEHLVDLTVTRYLEALASSAPTPGGGSASALAGALGAALVVMACNLTVGRAKFASVAEDLAKVRTQTLVLQADLAAAVDDDVAAYDAVSRAYKLPKGTDAEMEARAAAIQAALQGACAVPLRVAQRARAVITYARVAHAKANPNVASDALVAELLAGAGLQGAIANVEINLEAITDAAFAARMRAALAELRS